MNIHSFEDSAEFESQEDVDESVMDTLAMLFELEAMDEELLFAQHGYVKESTLCQTKHSELYKARRIDSDSDCDTKSNENESESDKARYVVIKRASRCLTNRGIIIQKGFQFLVSEHILSESSVLRELTGNVEHDGDGTHALNSLGADYIVRYIDSFESFDDYYLVMEYVESEMTLRQFVSKCHALMNNKQMSFAHYVKMIKFLLWQLCSTVHWMHTAKQTTHLDLNAENILVKNAHFSRDENDEMHIDDNICIKLCDFGVAAQFVHADNFASDKFGLNIDNEAYLAPEVFAGEIYDARDADNWSLGLILFECLAGRALYSPLDVAEMSNAYLALHRGGHRLKAYLKSSHLCQYFGAKSFSLLSQLLRVDATQRLNGVAILQHAWFASYYKAYGERIRN